MLGERETDLGEVEAGEMKDLRGITLGVTSDDTCFTCGKRAANVYLNGASTYIVICRKCLFDAAKRIKKAHEKTRRH